VDVVNKRRSALLIEFVLSESQFQSNSAVKEADPRTRGEEESSRDEGGRSHAGFYGINSK